MSKRDRDAGGNYVDPFAFLPRQTGISRQVRSAQPGDLMAALDDDVPPLPPASKPARQAAPKRAPKRKPAKKKNARASKPALLGKRAPSGQGRSILVACKVLREVSERLNEYARAEGMTRSAAGARLLAAGLAKWRAKVPQA